MLGEKNRLDLRKVEAGQYAGRYVLPKRIQFAVEFQSNGDAFDTLTEVKIDRDAAWLLTEEEMAQRRAAST